MRTLSLAIRLGVVAVLVLVLVHGCTVASPGPMPAPSATPALVAAVDGFTGPEAVRYDAADDVYFVANFNGASNAKDNNGFISRMQPDGRIDHMRFIAGGAGGVTLHAPRGMAIVGDTLWVADVDAVRAFHRRTGAPLASVSFAAVDVGFLNDVSPGPDGGIYVTDTGRNRIYRIAGVTARVALADTLLGAPNGMTWDGRSAYMVVVPFGGRRSIYAWTPGSAALRGLGTSATGGGYDGVEVRRDGSIVVASQADSSIHVFRDGTGAALFRVEGRPADIAWDSRRNRVAIPYIARNRVEIYQLP